MFLTVLEQRELWTPEVMNLCILLLENLKPHSMFGNVLCPKYLFLPVVSDNLQVWSANSKVYQSALHISSRNPGGCLSHC
jgi:hypothetical protein